MLTNSSMPSKSESTRPSRTRGRPPAAPSPVENNSTSPANYPLSLGTGGKEDPVQRASIVAFLRAKNIDPKGPFQLEMWPSDMRELPNDYARSALFTVRNKTEKRQSMERHQIFHVHKEVKITYTGVELRADDDELVWQQILDYAKYKPLGEPIEFNLHALCNDLGWSINGRNYEKARRSISRLKANEVRVESERHSRGVAISMIHDYEFEGEGEKGTKYRVRIHPNLILLFAGNTSTRLTWEPYRALTPIARRLYDYFASHKSPFPLKLSTFHSMCNSSCGTERKWRSMVKAACSEIVAAAMVKAMWIEDDFVRCDR